MASRGEKSRKQIEMLLEIHCHTSRYSRCSQVDPVTLVKQVVKKQLQGVIITEHHHLWCPDELLELRRDSEVEDNFLILSGQEVDTDMGHMLVFGASGSIKERTSVDDLRKVFPEAAMIWAHPFRGGRVPSERELLDKRIDAVEIFSSNHTPKENYLGLAAWHRYKFNAASGTDTHAKLTAGILPTQFDHPVRDICEVVEEVKKGRMRPFFKEIPKAGSNIVVTEITLGTKGEDEMRDRIILRSFSDEGKWKKMKSTLELTGKLYAKGFEDGPFRVPKVIDVNDDGKIVIEEGQRGKKLFELLSNVSPAAGKEYFLMAAKWLAKFHNAGITQGDSADPENRELRRLDSYTRAFRESASPYLAAAEELAAFVRAEEAKIFSGSAGSFVLNHGDYHPKNIIIGQDKMHDISTLYISVIDFDNAIMLPGSFDVGYFLSQMRSQFSAESSVATPYRDEDFLAAYFEASPPADKKVFLKQVGLFKVRANLSIASFFIKVGKGISNEMEDVISRSVEIVKASRGK